MAEKLDISSIEFGDIKTNLKSFLKGQNEFVDYDFEGSGMSVMLDVMAYTTHYMNYYTNMAINETFLDTATLRNSVVSHAKTLGYTPSSIKTAEAIVKLTFNTDGLDPSYITVDRGTTFTSSVNGVPMPFVISETTNITPDEEGEFSGEIKLYQGTMKQTEWTFDRDNEAQQFFIRDAGCDRESIQLLVNDIPWIHNERLSEIDNTSNIYFMQEGLDAVTELYFGNGIFGYIPLDGQSVKATYISTQGETGNYKSTLVDQVFSLDATIGSNYNADRVIVETVNISSYGDNPESTESIRLTAPKTYERQNRAVTAEDYKAILLEKYPNIDSISVWGGEDNDPPQYGAVFISIKPKHGLELSPLNKQKITDEILAKYNILAVNPIITSPEYTFIDVNTDVKYNPLETSLSAGEIEGRIIDNIDAFFKREISQFKSTLRYSRLTETIDKTDVSISNNLTTIKMYKKFYLQVSNTIGNYQFKFNNPLTPGSAVSSVFGATSSGSQMALLDDGQGNILLYDIVNEAFLNTKQGTIDYDEGTIELNGFNPVIDNNTVISLYSTPKSNDITTIRNNLLVLNSSNVSMQAI